jgi:NADH-quinone oxidoreductase subunit M
MNSVPWLEMTVFVPLAGALWLATVGNRYRASRWCLGFTVLTLAAAIGSWAAVRWGSTPADVACLVVNVDGSRFLAVDRLSAPLLPLVALLYFLTALTTSRTKLTRFSFAWLLMAESLALATFACIDPWPLVGLLALGTVPPALELFRRARPMRVYVLHMALFLGLLLAGVAAITAGHPAAGPALVMLAVLVRTGTIPAHVWVADLFENASFATALLFVTPMVGLYAAIRLVLPSAPNWVLEWAMVTSLATAFYATGLAVVQHDARRFFAYLFVGYSSLVLVGLELHTVVSLTGTLALWVSLALSLGGLGLTLRAIEGRFGRLSFRDYRGLYDQSPSLAICFLLTGLAGVGFPGTLGFVAGEILVDSALGTWPLVGLTVVAAGAINGIAIVRVYFLLFAGPRHVSGVPLAATPHERFAVLLLTALILVGGFLPQFQIASRLESAEIALGQRSTFRDHDTNHRQSPRRDPGLTPEGTSMLE